MPKDRWSHRRWGGLVSGR